MRKIAQCELMAVAAGVSPEHASHKESQPQVGFKEDLAIELIKIAFVAALNTLWGILFGPKEPAKEKDKENKDARYGRSSMVPF